MRLIQLPTLILGMMAWLIPTIRAQISTQWVHVLPNAVHSNARCIQPTPDGNLILAMGFSTAMDMDPGPAVQTFNTTSPGGADLFIGKYDTLGHLIWGEVIGGTQDIYATSLNVSSQGFIHVVGNFEGTIDFDPGPGVFNKTATGSLDGDYYLLRLDPNGNFIQAHSMGRNNFEAYKGVTTDAAGNAYYCGNWQYSADLDPGPGTLNVTASSAYCGFLVKVDFLGNLVWADVWAPPAFGAFFIPYDVSVGPSGDVYISAELYGTLDVDPGTGVTSLTSSGPSDMVMMRLDPSTGAMKRAVKGQGTGAASPTSIAVNSREEIYMAGTYTNALDLDPGPGTANHNAASSGSQTAFFVSWDSSGQYVWSSAFVQAFAEPFGLAVDANDNMVSTGYFGGTTDFDPGPGVYYLNSNNAIFYYSLDRTGAFRWAMNAGSTFCNGYDVCTTPDGSVYAAFAAWDDGDFDPGPGQYNVVLAPGAGVYGGILRLKECLARQSSLSASICEGQQYAFGGQNLSLPGTYTDTLTTIGGCDSIVTLTLSLTPPVQTSQTVDACESYSWGGTLLTASGTYTDTLQTMNECDSMVTLHLTLHTLSANATLNGSTLLASPANALSYQWLLCGNPNTPILNATSSTFTPTLSGSYAVQIADSFCSVTSACVSVQVVARADAPTQASRLHPNPNAGAFTLEVPEGAYPAQLSVLSLTGQTLWVDNVEGAQSHFDLGASLPGGSYLLRIHRADGRVEVMRMVKQ